jgi:hypothetical protein
LHKRLDQPSEQRGPRPVLPATVRSRHPREGCSWLREQATLLQATLRLERPRQEPLQEKPREPLRVWLRQEQLTVV